MQTFESEISKKQFPQKEKVTGSNVRQCVADEIKKDYPSFNEQTVLAASELIQYRNRYIQNTVTHSMGNLEGLEKQVVDAMNNDVLLTDKLREEDNKDKLTMGQRVADKVASFGGSWKFIIIFMVFLFAWIILNVIMIAAKAFDPYPFILLNLILSCIAALQAPVIMMSQNRQEEKDRERSKNDYMINLKSELEIRLLHEKLDHLIINQQEKLMEVQQVQMDMMNDIMERLDKKAVQH